MGKFSQIMESVYVDEKLKVLAPGVTASGETHSGEHVSKTYSGPSRMGDKHKATEFGKSHRKDAADKIKAQRAATGQPGSKSVNGKDGFAVYKEDVLNHILEFLDTNGSGGEGNDKARYHKQKQKEHESAQVMHRSRSSNSQDAHADAARAHRLASSNHQLAYMAHKFDSDNHEKTSRRSNKAEELSASAHKASKTANGE